MKAEHSQRGGTNIHPHGWSSKTRHLRCLRCSLCGKNFSERTGTPLFRTHLATEKILQIAHHVVEAGLTDHGWSLENLLTYPVFPPLPPPTSRNKRHTRRKKSDGTWRHHQKFQLAQLLLENLATEELPALFKEGQVYPIYTPAYAPAAAAQLAQVLREEETRS